MKINDKDPKTITCAVRLDLPLYQRLRDTSKKTHQNMSDLLRLGLIKQLDETRKQFLVEEIANEKLEQELVQVKQLKADLQNLIKKHA
jgi:predicted DNA-binding protein